MNAATPNKYPGQCHKCGDHVPAKAGTVSRTATGRGNRAIWHVLCAAHSAPDTRAEDGACSDRGYEDACAEACGLRETPPAYSVPQNSAYPWQCDPNGNTTVISATGRRIVDWSTSEPDMGFSEARANARLIAAAPELLDSVRALLYLAKQGYTVAALPETSLRRQGIDKAEAVIAKALGTAEG